MRLNIFKFVALTYNFLLKYNFLLLISTFQTIFLNSSDQRLFLDKSELIVIKKHYRKIAGLNIKDLYFGKIVVIIKK